MNDFCSGKIYPMKKQIELSLYPEFEELKNKIDWLITAKNKDLLYHFIDLEIKRISHKTFGEYGTLYKNFTGHKIRKDFCKDMMFLSKEYIKELRGKSE